MGTTEILRNQLYDAMHQGISLSTDLAILRELQDRLDIRTVVGHAAHPDVLERAGANDADIVVALTDTDETNMVACQVSYTLFHTPTKIATFAPPNT